VTSQAALGVTFMAKEEAEAGGVDMECGICYSYKLEGKIPEKVCGDLRCGRPFHQGQSSPGPFCLFIASVRSRWH
jgi:hypothetical protein